MTSKKEENEEDNSYYASSNHLIKDIIAPIIFVVLIVMIISTFFGVWPPFAAVQSQSMSPNIQKGDLVIIHGLENNEKIVTYNEGKTKNYTRFNKAGDVIIYYPNGNKNSVPVIHRVIKYVNKGDTVNGICVENFTAPSSGYITKGDNNPCYDQTYGISRIVKKEWILGKAKYRIPYLGYANIK